jgi:hypothetical protein
MSNFSIKFSFKTFLTVFLVMRMINVNLAINNSTIIAILRLNKMTSDGYEFG